MGDAMQHPISGVCRRALVHVNARCNAVPSVFLYSFADGGRRVVFAARTDDEALSKVNRYRRRRAR